MTTIEEITETALAYWRSRPITDISGPTWAVTSRKPVRAHRFVLVGSVVVARCGRLRRAWKLKPLREVPAGMPRCERCERFSAL